MANKVFTGRDAIVRIYNEASPTPEYVICKFLGDFEGPVGRTRPEEVAQLNQGKLDSLVHHNIQTDASLMEKPEITFGGKLHTVSTVDDLIIALSNPWNSATWSPGGTSDWTSAGVTTLGSIENADGTVVTFPPPVDVHRAASLVNIEVLWDGDTDWGLRYQGVYFEPSGISIPKGDEADTTFSCTGTVHGAITTIAAFTTGTEIV